MKPLYRGIAVAAIHCLLVLSIAGKYAYDREHLPRAWARALPADPNLPIRGRYVSLRLEVEGYQPAKTSDWQTWVNLSAEDSRLFAHPAHFDSGVSVTLWRSSSWTLVQPVAFFIPELVPDPSRRAAGEELWVEVSVPRRGPPRPIRLAVKKDGVLRPLDSLN